METVGTVFLMPIIEKIVVKQCPADQIIPIYRKAKFVGNRQADSRNQNAVPVYGRHSMLISIFSSLNRPHCSRYLHFSAIAV